MVIGQNFYYHIRPLDYNHDVDRENSNGCSSAGMMGFEWPTPLIV